MSSTKKPLKRRASVQEEESESPKKKKTRTLKTKHPSSLLSSSSSSSSSSEQKEDDDFIADEPSSDSSSSSAAERKEAAEQTPTSTVAEIVVPEQTSSGPWLPLQRKVSHIMVAGDAFYAVRPLRAATGARIVEPLEGLSKSRHNQWVATNYTKMIKVSDLVKRAGLTLGDLRQMLGDEGLRSSELLVMGHANAHDYMKWHMAVFPSATIPTTLPPYPLPAPTPARTLVESSGSASPPLVWHYFFGNIRGVKLEDRTEYLFCCRHLHPTDRSATTIARLHQEWQKIHPDDISHLKSVPGVEAILPRLRQAFADETIQVGDEFVTSFKAAELYREFLQRVDEPAGEPLPPLQVALHFDGQIRGVIGLRSYEIIIHPSAFRDLKEIRAHGFTQAEFKGIMDRWKLRRGVAETLVRVADLVSDDARDLFRLQATLGVATLGRHEKVFSTLSCAQGFLHYLLAQQHKSFTPTDPFQGHQTGPIDLTDREEKTEHKAQPLPRGRPRIGGEVARALQEKKTHAEHIDKIVRALSITTLDGLRAFVDAEPAEFSALPWGLRHTLKGIVGKPN